ncbi:MAG: hypothetical protein ACTHJT_10550 [Cytophaga sp.]|uniref:hypothetical protein n=1 Tax=Cytophaga sp. TaxID=29535 RepID=UPI003F80422A
MKTIVTILLTATFLLSSAICSNQHAAEKRVPFKVYIEQNGIRQPIVNNEVSLEKQPFNIVFVMHKPDGVLISSSFNKTTYEKAVKKEPLSKLPGYENTGMAEGLFNSDNEVIICDDAPSYWFYDNDKEHRFNTVVKSKDSLVCTRTIKQLYLLDEKDQPTITVEKASKPLYFVFVDYVSDPKTYKRTELQREMIKINWK